MLDLQGNKKHRLYITTGSMALIMPKAAKPLSKVLPLSLLQHQ